MISKIHSHQNILFGAACPRFSKSVLFSAIILKYILRNRCPYAIALAIMNEGTKNKSKLTQRLSAKSDTPFNAKPTTTQVAALFA